MDLIRLSLGKNVIRSLEDLHIDFPRSLPNRQVRYLCCDGMDGLHYPSRLLATFSSQKASTGTPEYILTREEIGLRLAFVYLPINLKGQEGESVSTISQIVKQAPPKVTNLKIIGDIREGNKVTVTRGIEASSRVQWFKSTYSTLEGENGLDALGTSKIAKDFCIPLGAVGYFVVAKFTPMTLNGESGELAYVISGRVVEKLCGKLSSCMTWFLTSALVETDSDTLYRRFQVSFNIVLLKMPSVNSFPLNVSQYVMMGLWVSQELAWGRNVINLRSSDGNQTEVKDATTASYILSIDDIGFFVSVSCEPVKSDWARGPIVLSEQIGPIIPGPPTCQSLKFLGSFVEGQRLSFIASYSGG
ncbi:hypothetical protein C3L33_00908, partial [Rhododendron williamsianum]